MNDKIMAGDNLDDIVCRLTACAATFHALRIGMGMVSEKVLCDALYGACDLLECIVRDSQADIDSADDYRKGAAVC